MDQCLAIYKICDRIGALSVKFSIVNVVFISINMKTILVRRSSNNLEEETT